MACPPGSQRHVGSGLGKCLCEGNPESGGGASHDGNFAVEPKQIQNAHRHIVSLTIHR
jgi:hypothetical protein